MSKSFVKLTSIDGNEYWFGSDCLFNSALRVVSSDLPPNTKQEKLTEIHTPAGMMVYVEESPEEILTRLRGED